MSELMCPFCGGEAELQMPAASFVICSKCGVSTPYIYPPEEAVCRWNNRFAEDALQERIAKLEAERDRLREALQEIKHVPCRKEGGMYDSDGDWYVNECSSCRRMHDIAREALKGAGE